MSQMTGSRWPLFRCLRGSGAHIRASALAALMLAATMGASGQSEGDVVLRVPDRANATPWVAASGRDVAVVWGASAAGSQTDVYAAVSRDAGATFGAPVRVNRRAGEARLGGELPPRVSIAPGPKGPAMAVLWTARTGGTSIQLARSSDFGRTFTVPITLQAGGAPGDRGWPSLALDARGTAHAVWLDHRGLAADSNAEGAHRQHGAAAEHDGVAMAQKSALYYARVPADAAGAPASNAGSRSPSSSERALEHGVCYCCKTALAVGPRGTLFAAWRHVYPGNFRDIAFSLSRDGGRTFAPAARASEDRWAINGCPDDGPAMAVDNSGTAHIVWPTVIGGDEPRGAIFYSSTRDGRTFTARVQVPTLGSLKPSHPQIAVDAAGRMMVAWDESIDGRRVAAVRALTMRGSTPAFGDIVRLDEGRAAVYPVLAAVEGGFVAVWTSGVGDASVIRVRRLAVR